mmetsp:Transcript_4739/g.12157  ORF Transcript_4739/g.12157 Transcript_4739/m.12157 type:complete len:292 (+) Transcript_4739:881-1756(+)
MAHSNCSQVIDDDDDDDDDRMASCLALHDASCRRWRSSRARPSGWTARASRWASVQCRRASGAGYGGTAGRSFGVHDLVSSETYPRTGDSEPRRTSLHNDSASDASQSGSRKSLERVTDLGILIQGSPPSPPETTLRSLVPRPLKAPPPKESCRMYGLQEDPSIPENHSSNSSTPSGTAEPDAAASVDDDTSVTRNNSGVERPPHRRFRVDIVGSDPRHAKHDHDDVDVEAMAIAIAIAAADDDALVVPISDRVLLLEMLLSLVIENLSPNRLVFANKGLRFGRKNDRTFR